MTTTTNPGNYVDFDEYVGLKLEKTRSTIRTTDFLTASAGVAAMFLAYLLVFVVLDQWVVRDGFGVGWRWALLSTLMVSTIAWLVWKIGIPSFRTVNGLFAAKEIEKSEPGLKGNLLNLIDLKASGRSINPVIMKALERRAAVRLQEVDVTHAIDHRPLVRTAYVLLAVIVLFCLYALFSPKKISNSIWRGLLPAAEVPLATRTEILSVKPGDVTIPAHTTALEVQVDLGGEIPHQVWMLYTTSDGRFNRQPVELRVEAEGQTRFKGQLVGESAQGLMQDVSYVIKAGDAESQPFKITVEQPPSAEIETVRIEFPPYMKLDPIIQSQNGQIDAWEGAKILVDAKTNMPVRSGTVQFLEDPQVGPTGEELPMSVSSGGRQLQATWNLALRNDGTFPKYYRIDCKTEDGRRDTAPTNHSLTIRPDLPPDVLLLQPERDLEAPANATIPLLIQASDPDFELGYLYLNVEKEGQRISHEILSEGRQPKLMIKHDLVLSKLKASVGDSFELWIEAYDNKQPRPNTRNTPKIKIRVLEPVTKKEADQQLAERQERREEKMAEAERETNPEAGGKPSQSDDESKMGKPENEPRSNETDPAAEKKTDLDKSDLGQETDRQQSGQNKQDASSKQKEREQAQTNKTSKNDREKQSDDPAGKDRSDAESKKNQPISSDGSQDDEAIKRLSEKLNKDARKPNPKPADSDPSRTAEAADPLQSKSESDQSEKPPKSPESQDKKQSGTEPPNNGKTPSPENSGNESKDKPTSNEDKTDKDQRNLDAPNSKENPGTKSENGDSTSKTEEMKSDSLPAEGAEGAETPKTDQNPDAKNKKNQEKASEKTGESNPDQKSVNQEHDKSDEAKSEKTDQVKPEKSDTAKDDKNSEKNPGQPGKGSNEKNSTDSDKSPAKTKSDQTSSDDLPTGLNEDAPKQKDFNKADKSKQKPNESDTASDGPRENASDSPNAKKKSGDGTEKGPAKPDRDPDSKPKQTKTDDVKRDPNEKPETRPGDAPADNQQKPSKEKQPNQDRQLKTEPRNQETPASDPKQKSADNNEEMRQDGSGKTKPDNNKPEQQKQDASSDSPDADSQKPADQPKSNSDSTKSKQDSNQQKKGSADFDPNSDSSPGKKSEDEPGSKSNPNQNSSDDQTSSKDPGANPDQKSGAEKPGKNTGEDKKQDGSKPKSEAQGGDKKGGDKSGGDKKGGDKSSDSKQSNSKPGSEKGSEGKGEGNTPGKPSSSSAGSAKPGQTEGDSKGGGGQVADGEGSATEGGDTPPAEPGEEANLEYNKQATELILQKLKKELERGEVDPELLEQLGWNQEEMKQFADRLSKYLDESKRVEESPEAKARHQQFEEMLKNLDLQKSGAQRSGEKEPKRDVSQIESKRTPVPPAYRSAYEKFTRDMARQKTSSGKKN